MFYEKNLKSMENYRFSSIDSLRGFLFLTIFLGHAHIGTRGVGG